MVYGQMIKAENALIHAQSILTDWPVLESNAFQNVHQILIFMQMMTVEIVNSCVHWVSFPIQLTENANLDVSHCSSTISDVFYSVQMDIMPTQLVIVYCPLYVIQVYLMVRMEQQNALLLVLQDLLLIPTLITVLQFVPMAGLVMLISADKFAKLQTLQHRQSPKHVEQTVQNLHTIKVVNVNLNVLMVMLMIC